MPRLATDPALYFEAHFFMCTNRRPEGHPRGSCAASGSEKLRDYAKARAKELGVKGVRVNGAACLDRCEFGPTIVIYPEGVWYQARTADDIDEILETHLRQGGRVERLMIAPDQKIPEKA